MKFILIILDGLGLRDQAEANAFKLAKTPVLDDLLTHYPCAKLETSGSAVGLPDGIIGNSEVGHMTIGSGRIVEHDLVRINKAIESGQFGKIPEFINILDYVLHNNVNLHLIGLLSDGGVHSHINHLFEILRCIKEKDLQNVYFHVITDGRDTSPTSGVNYVKQTIQKMSELRIGKISTVMGRYYAMDRDKRWDRTKIAFEAMRNGKAKHSKNPIDAIKASYKSGVTDEFIKPIIFEDENGITHPILEGDAILFFNFRADRMRQITRALSSSEFHEFERNVNPVRCTTMTNYDDTFTYPFLFEPIALKNIFPEILEKKGYKQLRIAETEKYAHVTYFFNGGMETPFPNEDRILIPSPKVATYDLKPEMSAPIVMEKVLEAIHSNTYDCIIVNFANPDMVGHTGNINAAIIAVETIDAALGEIIDDAKKKSEAIFITSDHGNLEMMIDDETGEMHTAHTMNLVPFIMISSKNELSLQPTGGLSDIAPTILNYFDIPIPDEMTGKNLLIIK